MKKLMFLLMPLLLVFAVNFAHADAVPDIRGEYSGSYTIVVSNCSDSSDNGTYYAVLAMSISTQTGNTFSGTATGTFDPGLVDYIQLSGTITESGQISYDGKTPLDFTMLPLLSTFLLAEMANWAFSVLFSSSQIFLEDLHFFSFLASQAFHRFQQIALQEYRGR